MITLAWDCCEWHDTGRSDYYSAARSAAQAAESRLTRRGEVGYTDVHLIARLRLGMLEDAHATCNGCGILDRDASLQAALNWPAVPDSRLRECKYSGLVYSVSPDDYLALCLSCHRRLDSCRVFLGHSNVGTTEPAGRDQRDARLTVGTRQ